MQLLSPSSWKDYELIDSGRFEKLERFGKYILIRPEPQAMWERELSDDEWYRMSHAHFTREQTAHYRFGEEINGGWKKLKPIPDSWDVTYQYKSLSISLQLALTSFGHVGIFPEQGQNWNFMFDTLKEWNHKEISVLNLFAYTGAASIVAKVAGAQVTHVDASRPGLNWANENQQKNNLEGIRWVYEDALKFVKREVKRKKHYQGIIMDPPPYGRGPTGEKWTLEKNLNELVKLSSELLEAKNSFLILSMYAVGFSSLVGLNVAKTHFAGTDMQFGELFLSGKKDKKLPMGTFLRFKR